MLKKKKRLNQTEYETMGQDEMSSLEKLKIDRGYFSSQLQENFFY